MPKSLRRILSLLNPFNVSHVFLIIYTTMQRPHDVTMFFTEYTKAQRRARFPRHSQQSQRRSSTPAIFLRADGQRDTWHPAGFRGSRKQSHKRSCHPRGGQGGNNPRRCISGVPVTNTASSRNLRRGGRTATVLVMGKQQCWRRQPRVRTT